LSYRWFAESILDTKGYCTVRLDKWLWAARFYKTRSLASDQIAKGRVSVNDAAAKASRELHVGDRITLQQGDFARTVVVEALSEIRGPASIAQMLYCETPESIQARAAVLEARKVGAEPAHAIEQGRPTKRDRRKLAEWTRWSASTDPKPR
jgi:ribosome-associated heat shock protein Hsp15